MIWQDIPGWFTFASLYQEQVDKSAPNAIFVEVGSFLGRSAAFMAGAIKQSGKSIRFHAVDCGDGFATLPGDCAAYLACLGMTPSRNVGRKFHENMVACGVEDAVHQVVMSSVYAAVLFADESIDFCFLDASHDKDSVLDDLRAWWPKVKLGGVLAGHDYASHGGVSEAVDEFFGESLPYLEDCWLKRKPD